MAVVIDAGTKDSHALDSMRKKIDALPLLPQALVGILGLDPDSDDYFDDFESLVVQDPTFAVRVIALANSAASSPICEKSTIRDAVVRLGVGTISELIASLAVQQVFVPTKPFQIQLWHHSITVAVASRHIACQLSALDVKPEYAYLCGLLHDIGRFVMLEHSAQQFSDVDATDWQTPDELIDADLDVYKYTHAELGYLACKHWGLADSIAKVARTHHTPISDAISAVSIEAVQTCIQISDRLDLALIQGAQHLSMNDADIEKAICEKCLITPAQQKLLNPATLKVAIPAISEQANKLIAGLGLPKIKTGQLAGVA